MESHHILGPPREFNHMYGYQTADSYCIAIQLRPPYESRGGGREIHKITSDWDSRKGVDELTPNDMMIKFTERSIEVCKRGGSSAWHMIRGLHGPTYQQLQREKCYWTMTRHGGRYWLISIELIKKTPGKLWSRLMRDEREANRPNMRWDKEMQKAPMIMDKGGNFVPSTYCHPTEKPKYELEVDDLDEVLIEEMDMLEDGQATEAQQFLANDLVERNFELEESTLSLAVSMRLNEEVWRRIQRERGSSDVFALEVPFGGKHIDFYLKGDKESPILRGTLGGCVWRRGCRWYVEQRQGRSILELYMPKQTPEPWSYVVEGYERLSRTAYDPYQQMILDGLWDDEAIEEKAKGDSHFRESEYRAAVKCYERTLERNPDSYITLTNRAAARLAFETEKFKVEEILEDAQRALEINPSWYKAKFREGIALTKLHRYDEAIWSLEAGQRMDKSNHAGWEEEIEKVKEERIRWHNRKKLSYLHDVE
mmetsp:Transcript_57953/g.137955  ORF Transcript_57953/g.137955 Transcript_57953/m.137955 type:complete len:481 (-) Transcript_57953:67-1509(-)|eukprot:CAMPEP_0178383778 /NCGR_PEP_ID=MMETSP0689_2-20121128/7174_1 /TAXON_ID=160604 /ORGANISM="Amphidinium massartii, Strain CS-259" /LENGTH=480 /DNA_ID=CAMNT_0020004003 /DNA_START=32 /DNA_END=1474 /DNA_ORIENTATION=-